MHAGLQTSLGILEPEHLYPGTGDFVGNQRNLWYVNGVYGICWEYIAISWDFREFCGVEWECTRLLTGLTEQG